MIEEPYRWVEAVANRREYIETQLAAGSPIVALKYDGGILLFTAGGTQRKIFEVYDRIAMGVVGHPGDVERLRLTAIELASSEGFTRSAADVSLRRLTYYSLSPLMKTAFEQIYGAPFLARLLFAELGRTAEEDLLVELEYDGSIAAGSPLSAAGDRNFAAIAGTSAAGERMRSYLESKLNRSVDLATALAVAARAAAVGKMTPTHGNEAPDDATIDSWSKERKAGSIEAAVLERASTGAICYRSLAVDELKSATV